MRNKKRLSKQMKNNDLLFTDVRVSPFDPAKPFLIEEFDDACINGPFIPIRSLFPVNYQFPSIDTMSEDELSNKLDEISDIYLLHNIKLSFVGKLPDKVLYNHLINEVIPEKEIIEKKMRIVIQI